MGKATWQTRDKKRRRVALGLDRAVEDDDEEDDDEAEVTGMKMRMKMGIRGDIDMSDPSGDEGDDDGEDAEGEESEEIDDAPVEGTREEVAQIAIEEIRRAIADPDVQAGGVTFVPPNWAKRYKGVLGGYKEFLKKHSDTFVLIKEKGGFVVQDIEDVEPAAPPAHMPWKAAITRAWTVYCKEVQREHRDFRVFLAGLPAIAAPVVRRSHFAQVVEAAPSTDAEKQARKKKRKTTASA